MSSKRVPTPPPLLILVLLHSFSRADLRSLSIILFHEHRLPTTSTNKRGHGCYKVCFSFFSALLVSMKQRQ